MRHPLELITSLEDIDVTSPCAVRWDAMTGDKYARFCAQCGQHVYDLSTLTTAQALALIRDKEADLCVRFYRRRGGTIKTADCNTSSRRRVGRHWLLAPLAALITLILSLAGTGCTQGK